MASTNPSTRIVPKIVFPVADMDQATAFYRKLGFEVEHHDGSYGWVTHIGDEILHLAVVDELDPEANHAAGYFHVQDAADWHAAWNSSGVELSELVDHPWGMREFSLRDPSGNLLRVGQNL